MMQRYPRLGRNYVPQPLGWVRWAREGVDNFVKNSCFTVIFQFLRFQIFSFGRSLLIDKPFEINRLQLIRLSWSVGVEASNLYSPICGVVASQACALELKMAVKHRWSRA